MMHCVHCDTELVAPVKSEYWSEFARNAASVFRVWSLFLPTPALRTSSGSLATFAAIDRASLESNLAADRRPRNAGGGAPKT